MPRWNPENPVDLQRLTYAIDWSRWKLQSFRQHRLAALQQYVGNHYSETGAEDRVPLNLLQLAVQIYLRQLVARAPRALVTSRTPLLKPLAANMMAWIDQAVKEMNLVESLRRWALDALFCMGFMKVGCYETGDIELQGTLMRVGQAFAEPVDLDDIVFDIMAKRWDQRVFAGNRYDVLYDEARENKHFDKKAREALTPTYQYAYNERGDQRPSTLSQGTASPYDQVMDRVQLWDIEIPEEGIIVTIAHQDQPAQAWSGPPLEVRKWTGPKEGPYIPLSFVDVPDNIVGAAPVTAWMDLHDISNRVWRKLARQAERQKTVTLVDGRSVDDGTNIMNASDGEIIRVNRPDGTREARYGGVDQANFLFAENLRQVFDFMAGNLSTLGGLAPQAATLGQDKLLNQNASAQLAEMQDRMVAGTQKVYQSLANHWWANPTTIYTSTREVLGATVPVIIPPSLRKIPFELLDFQIDPFSMAHDTPQTRLQGILGILERILLPNLGQMAQQGATLKWPETLKLLGNYGNWPELSDLIAIGPPPDQQGAAQQVQQATEGARMPANTTRTNIRQGRPTTTPQGNSVVLQQLLAKGMGNGAVPAQGGR